MKKTLLNSVLFLLFSAISFGQSKNLAERYFKEFSYPRAAEQYKGLYLKGDNSKEVVQRIAECYYNNAQTKKSEKWYEILVRTHGDKVSQKTLFYYAQSIRANGNYKKSDSLLATLTDYKLSGITESTDFIINNSDKKGISIRNLVTNTKYSDFGSFLKDDVLYFASSNLIKGKRNKLYKWNNQPFLNIYTTTGEVIDVESNKEVKAYKVNAARLLKGDINTQYHESNAVITKDGNRMYFTRLNSSNGKSIQMDKNNVVNLKLYTAELSGDKWSNVKELPFNSKSYSVGHPALSPDGKTLYFISDMPGSLGKTDIYKVTILGGDRYSRPVNLGAGINTPGKEMFPFVGKDEVLYFSSDGHAGLGLMDIFQSKIMDGSQYSKVVNLGYPFNSTRDDFAFFINDEGTTGFFSSNRSKGKGDDDVYSFMMEPEPEECLQNIAGHVKDKNQDIIAEATVNLFTKEGTLIKTVISGVDGSYDFKEVPCSGSYKVIAEKSNYKSDNQVSRTTKASEGTVDCNLSLEPLIVDNKIVINPIYFDYDKHFIRDEAKYELEEVITVMKDNPDMIINIESHTDSRASAGYNKRLSDRRAKSTRKYIVSRGIASDRIPQAIGYGESQLLNHCDDANIETCSEEEHQLNRRSYFIIVSGAPNVEVQNKAPEVIDRSGASSK